MESRIIPDNLIQANLRLLKNILNPGPHTRNKFDNVFRRLEYGDSFLTNLTIKTEIILNRSLRDIFFQSRAKYKLLFGDEFLVFSPETFIQIRGRQDLFLSYEGDNRCGNTWG